MSRRGPAPRVYSCGRLVEAPLRDTPLVWLDKRLAEAGALVFGVLFTLHIFLIPVAALVTYQLSLWYGLKPALACLGSACLVLSQLLLAFLRRWYFYDDGISPFCSTLSVVVLSLVTAVCIYTVEPATRAGWYSAGFLLAQGGLAVWGNRINP
jgi:peptidoglycan biosynthesis protein MviN/MurJ (putative lipid II flippase)